MSEIRIYNYENRNYIEELCHDALEKYKKRYLTARTESDFVKSIDFVGKEIRYINPQSYFMSESDKKEITNEIAEYYGINPESIIKPQFGAPYIIGFSVTDLFVANFNMPRERIKEIVSCPINYLPSDIKKRLPGESDDAYSIRLHLILFELSLYNPFINSYVSMLEKYSIDDDLLDNEDKINRLLSKLKLTVPNEIKYRATKFAHLFDNELYIFIYENYIENINTLKSQLIVHLDNLKNYNIYIPEKELKSLLVTLNNPNISFQDRSIVVEELVSSFEATLSQFIEVMLSCNFITIFYEAQSALESKDVVKISSADEYASLLDIKSATYAEYLSNKCEDLLRVMISEENIDKKNIALDDFIIILNEEISTLNIVKSNTIQQNEKSKVEFNKINRDGKVVAAQKMRVITASQKFDVESYAKKYLEKHSYFDMLRSLEYEI